MWDTISLVAEVSDEDPPRHREATGHGRGILSLVPGIHMETTIAAPPEEVWRRLADIADHVTWMADAAEIRFTSDRRSGVGTVFECETRVGPLRTTDVMEVTEWRDAAAMGVRHTGLFTGTGRFALEAAPAPAPISADTPAAAHTPALADADTPGAGRGATVLSWEEDLVFPWWLGGPVGAWAARPILRRVWRGNLRRFSALVMADAAD